MADEEIDLVALGAEEEPSTGQGDDEELDLMALGVGQSASDLATHRWARVKMQGGSSPDALPVTGVPDTRSLQQVKADQQAQVGPGLYPRGEPKTSGPGLLGDLKRFGKDYDPRIFAQQKNIPGTPISVRLPNTLLPIPDLPTAAPVTEAEVPNRGERFARNIGVGAANIIPGTANFFLNIAKHPIQSTQDLVHLGKIFSQFGLWSVAHQLHPKLGAMLVAKGVDPTEFAQAFEQDPVNTAIMVLAPAGGALRGLRGGAPRGADLTPPTLIDPAAAAAEASRTAKTAAYEAEARRVQNEQRDISANRDAELRSRAASEEAIRAEQARGLALERGAATTFDYTDPASVLDVGPEEQARRAGYGLVEGEPRTDLPPEAKARANAEFAHQHFKSWTMERGFESSDALNTVLSRLGRDALKPILTSTDFNKTVKDTQTKLKQPGKFGSEKGAIPMEIFQDLYRVGEYLFKKAKDYASWAAEMTKHFAGRVTPDALRNLWNDIKAGSAWVKEFAEDAGRGIVEFIDPLEDFSGKPAPKNRAGLPELREVPKATERRTTGGATKRRLVTDQVEAWQQAGWDLQDALTEIRRRRMMDEISGPEESALMRQAQNTFSEKMRAPEEGPVATPEGRFNKEQMDAKYQEAVDRGLFKGSPDAVEPAPPNPEAFAAKPFKEKLYRGERPELLPGQTYRTDPGDLGAGEYWTTNPHMGRTYAGAQGGKFRHEEVTLKNPLYLTAKEAVALGEKYSTVEAKTPAERLAGARRLTEDLRAQGYDGIVAEGYEGEGHRTVVKFAEASPIKQGTKAPPNPEAFGESPVESPEAWFDREIAEAEARGIDTDPLPNNVRPFRPKKKGPTLSMLGGQEMYERTLQLAKSLVRATPNFEAWAAQMKTHARALGAALSDADIRALWNHADVASQRPPETNKAAADAAVRAVAAGKEDTPVSRRVGQDVIDAALNIADKLTLGALNKEWANKTVNVLEDMTRSHFGTNPAMSRVRHYFPKVYEAATRYMTSRGLAFIKSNNHFNNLSIILDSKKLRNLFADLILDDRARALENKAAEMAALRGELAAKRDAALQAGDDKAAAAFDAELDDIIVPEGHNVPKLDDATRAAALQNPEIRRAIAYWRERVIPDYERLSTQAGVNARLNGPLGLYNKMRWIREGEKTAQSGRERELLRQPGSGTSNSPYDVAPKKSGSRKAATGRGPKGFAPENSLLHMLNHTFEDRLTAVTKENLRNAVRETAIASGDMRGKHIDSTRNYGGRVEPIVDLNFTENFKRDTQHVPAMVSDAYRMATERRWQDKARNIVDAVSNLATVQTVAMPAEAVRHGFNVVGVMATLASRRIPGLARYPESLSAAATLTTSRMAAAVSEAFSLHGPELAAWVERLSEGGALRLSGYEGYGGDAKSLTMRLAEKVPGIHKLKDTVFGDPGMNKGFSGIETRLRIVLAKMIEADNPGISNVELGRKVNKAMGTYVSPLAPSVSKLLRPIDPFIRAGTAMTTTGIKNAFGFDAAGKFHGSNLVATYGTLIAAAYYSKFLDDKGEFPWEKPDWKPTTPIMIERGGKMYTWGLNDIAGPLSRALSFSGLRNTITSLKRGERKFSNLADDTLDGLFNFMSSRWGPGAKSVFTTFTGKLPYRQGGEFLPGYEPSMAGSNTSPFASRMGAVGEMWVPWASKLIDATGLSDTEGKKVVPDTPLAKFFYKTNELIKTPFVPTLKNPSYERPYVQHRLEKQFDETVSGIVRRARNLDPQDWGEFITKEISARISNEFVRGPGGDPVPAQVQALEEILRRLTEGEPNAIEGLILQELNKNVPPPPPQGR